MSDVTNTAAEENVMKIEVAQEDKLPFPTVAYSEYMSSDDFCKTAKPLFGTVFGDFVGFGVYLDTSAAMPVLTMSAFFKQVDDAGDAFQAFSRDVTGKNDQNSGIQRIQRFERVASEGNKFHLNDEAKEMIAPFMHVKALNHKGEVVWDRAGVVTYRASQSAFSAPITYSVINYIDPIKILREIYGSKANIYVGNDESGNAVIEEKEVAYQIIPMPMANGAGQMVQAGPEGPFNLYINQVDLENAHSAAVAVGINVQFGPRIAV